MWTSGPAKSALRDYVLMLARRGEIGSLDEAALIADVSRDTVHRWLAVAGVDWRKARDGRLVVLRERALAIAQGKPRRPRITKAQQRDVASRAKRAWDRSKS